MKIIDDLEYLKNNINNSMLLIENKFTVELIEYYISNSNDVDWLYIAVTQPMTIEFIERYTTKMSFIWLLYNDSLDLSIEYIEENLYNFNLYEAVSSTGVTVDAHNSNNSNINGYTFHSPKNIEKVKKLIDKYKHKYEIDKLAYELIR